MRLWALAVVFGILPQVLQSEPFVDTDPTMDDVLIWDQVTEDPTIVSPPGHETEIEPEPMESSPFRCRPNAPYPGTDISCDTPPEPTETEAPTVTPGDVLEETKRIGLPRLTVTVQPPGTTLVNLDTIFHTTTQPFERTVTILDSTVTLRAQPTTYTWHHGDGTTHTTTTPGRPYPATDITHRYTQPGHTHTHVDATYTVTYRIDNQPWQQLDTTITATGPTTPLRIREAQPVLTR